MNTPTIDLLLIVGSLLVGFGAGFHYGWRAAHDNIKQHFDKLNRLFKLPRP